MNHQYFQASNPQSNLEVNTHKIFKEDEEEPTSSRFFKLFGIVIALVAFVALTSRQGGPQLNGFASTNKLFSSTDSYTVTVSVYSDDYDEIDSLSLLPWDAVVETARPQIITVSSVMLGDEVIDISTGYDFAWTIDGASYSGQTVDFQIDTNGVRDCTVVITPTSTLRRKLASSTSRRVLTSKKSQIRAATAKPASSQDTKSSKKKSTKKEAGPSGVFSTPTTTTTTSTSTTAASSASTGAEQVTATTTATPVSDSTTQAMPSDTSAPVMSSDTAATTATPTAEESSSSSTASASSPYGSTESIEYQFTMAVKYVRRELRTLTDDDRDRFLDALKMLYSVDEVPGKKLYGEKFNTAEYFSYKHLNAAGTTDCDHWHDGAGVVTHHMAFTLEVEQALQSIDPAISMPYWEYGLDNYIYDSWSESIIFDADWFGESSPTNAMHAIQDGGRWDLVEVPDGADYMDWSIAETGSLNPFVNGYGMMRSPWNNNPTKYIGRHNETYSMTQYGSMPTCGTLQSCFQSDSLADINDCLNGATHGPVHILIGGSWGEGTLFDDEDIQFAQKPDKLLFFKVLWRMGYTRCPETCTFGQSCKCAVPDEYIEEYGAEAILKATNIYYAYESELTDASDELFLKLLRAVEDPGIAGEMFSSAAGIDPSFWPLHGAAERLVDYKRILISQGDITDFDDTWAYTEYNEASGAAYLNGVCDWSKVAGSGDLTFPTCTLDVTCFGHNENDLIEFSNFLGTGDAYTNVEFFDFLHPWTDDLPYAYDTFNYDYCTDEGYDFMDETEVVINLPIPSSSTGTDSAPSSSTGTGTGTSSGPSSATGTGAGPSGMKKSATAKKSAKPTYKGLAKGQSLKKATRKVGDYEGANQWTGYGSTPKAFFTPKPKQQSASAV